MTFTSTWKTNHICYDLTALTLGTSQDNQMPTFLHEEQLVRIPIEDKECVQRLNKDQLNAQNTMMNIIQHNQSHVSFFLDLLLGTCKSFFNRVVIATLGSKGKIVLVVASSIQLRHCYLGVEVQTLDLKYLSVQSHHLFAQ